MKKIFVRILILGIIVSLIFCPAVSARNTADGLEKIEIGDIVFLGEDNLDFSSFSRNGNLVDSLRTGLDQASIILLTNQIGNIPSNTATGLYYAFNNTAGQLDYASFCTVKNPADYVFGLEVPPSLHTGDTEEIILTGKPYETYYLSISPDAGPKFSDGSYSKQIIMNTAGKETFQIIVPNTAEQGTYTISVRDSDGKVISKSVTLTLKSTQVTVTLDEFSLDMLNGKFAVGDLMKITAHIIPAPDDLKQPLYGFVTGPNLPVNGANFEGEAVVDGKTGFMASEINEESYYQAMVRALDTYYNKPEEYEQMIMNCLNVDFSWAQKGKKGSIYEYTDKLGLKREFEKSNNPLIILFQFFFLPLSIPIEIR